MARPLPQVPTTQSPLTLACAHGHAELVQTLLDLGANPCQNDYQNLPTPVYEAAQNGHTGVLKTLIRHNPAVLSMANDTNFFNPVLAAAEGTRRPTP